MKIPSIIKIPKHQRYNVEPRYYDPVKEDISQRTSRIKKELEFGVKGEEETEANYQSRISGSFSGRINKKEKSSVGVVQFVLIVVFCISVVGYLYFGNVAAYLLGIFMLLFVYLKFKKIF